MKIDKRKMKVHVIFASLLLCALLVGLVFRMGSGERFVQAAWGSFRDVRPFEWVMIIIFWYAAASNKLKDSSWYDPPITLGLANRKTG